MIVQNVSNKFTVKHQAPTRQEQKGAISQIKMHIQKRDVESFGSELFQDGGDNRSESLPMMDNIVWPIGTKHWKYDLTRCKIIIVSLRNWIFGLPHTVHCWWQRVSTTVEAPPCNHQ